jgi:hypothetical protein
MTVADREEKTCLPFQPAASWPFPRMNDHADTSPRFLGLSPARAVIVLLAITTLFRFFYSVWLPLLPDEAYYFQWSKHLDASYISKGPAVAYTIWAGTHLFGPNVFGVRFFAVLIAAGTGWQVFLLSRRCYDETTGLIAVLVMSVVPLYAIGAVVMTIDPLSAFFWVWAANHFVRATRHDELRDWLLAGFAIGCGFLAKPINALELLASVAFVLIVPHRRALLRGPGFWLMLVVALIAASPVFWWNWQHHWVTASALSNRGKLNGPFVVQFSTFVDFVLGQALVLSPFLFLALLLTVIIALARWLGKGGHNEGELLLFLLFIPVFLMYAVLAWHLREEPNWPAVSYLSLIIIMASHWRKMLLVRPNVQPFIIIVFVSAWLLTLLVHITAFLPLPQKADPMVRVTGWPEIASRLGELQREQAADGFIADGYKEASIFSFYMPGQPFVFAMRHDPPATQYDLWPGYRELRPKRVLYVTSGDSTDALARDFNTFSFVEREIVFYRGKPYRIYDVYLGESH